MKNLLFIVLTIFIFSCKTDKKQYIDNFAIKAIHESFRSNMSLDRLQLPKENKIKLGNDLEIELSDWIETKYNDNRVFHKNYTIQYWENGNKIVLNSGLYEIIETSTEHIEHVVKATVTNIERSENKIRIEQITSPTTQSLSEAFMILIPFSIKIEEFAYSSRNRTIERVDSKIFAIEPMYFTNSDYLHLTNKKIENLINNVDYINKVETKYESSFISDKEALEPAILSVLESL